MKQTKRLILLLVFFLISPLWGCDANKREDTPTKLSTEIPEAFKEQFKKLNLLHYKKGNFTGSGKDEYIVFYENPAHTAHRDKAGKQDIAKIMIFSMMGTEQPKLYEINDSSLAFDDWTLKIITNEKLQFGSWDGYCRIADYNENGLEEVMFFGLAGLGFFVDIYEYQNGKMECVLESPPTYTLTISGIETIIKKNKKYIKIYGSGGSEKPGEIAPEGYRDWYLYSWNKGKGVYEIIKKGIEKWNKEVTKERSLDASGPRYLSEKDRTWGNQAAFDVMETTGVDISKFIPAGKTRYDTRANDIGRAAQRNAEKGILTEVSGNDAQRLANHGFTVIAIWQNPSGKGHVATVYAITDEYDPSEGPWLSNVGSKNEVLTVKEGFAVGKGAGAPELRDIKYYYDPQQKFDKNAKR